jgi:hypothetical protein
MISTSFSFRAILFGLYDFKPPLLRVPDRPPTKPRAE